MEEWAGVVRAELPDIEKSEAAQGSKRKALLRVWALIAEVPAKAKNVSRLVSEAAIEEEVAALCALRAANKRSVASRLHQAKTEKDLVRILIAYARVLDTEAYALHSTQALVDPETQCLVNIAGVSAYVIPFPMRGRIGPRPPSANAPIHVRAIRYHRILPAALSAGTQVRLVSLPGPDGRLDPKTHVKNLKLGGGLFPGLKLSDADSGDGFIVTGITSAAHENSVLTHLGQGAKSKRDIVIFPELTIDAKARAKIEDYLTGAVATGAPAPMLVVAGSWHEADGEGLMRNAAPIYASAGQKVSTHLKMAAYNWEGRGPEAIEPGDEIVCVVTRMGIFAVAICLDFCDCANPNPYDELDVDCVLVISMGNDATMKGHTESAHGLFLARRAAAFVVQQPEAGAKLPDGVVGYVLRAETSKLIELAETLATADWAEWR